MDSTRFASKVLEEIAGRPILEHVVSRCVAAGLPTVVATTDRMIDDLIAAWLVQTGLSKSTLFRWDGDVDDVLGRYQACARHMDADAIVRVTGDSPFVPSAAIQVVAEQLTDGVDVAALTFDLGVVPDGWEVEGCVVGWLGRVNASNPTRYEREHVFPGIYSRLLTAGAKQIHHPAFVEGSGPWSEPWLLRQKFSVDTPADLDWLRCISQQLDCTPPNPTATDLVAFLWKYPEMQRQP